MQPDTLMLNQPSQPVEAQVQHPTSDSAILDQTTSPAKEVHPAKSPHAREEVAQNGGGATRVAPPLGSTSASKNRLITDFLPRINSVPALTASMGGQVTTKFDRECHPELNDKVSPFSVANLSQVADETRPSTIPCVCKSCGAPYPTEAASDVPMPQGNVWECGPCLDTQHARLITELKEKARLKALEREQRELQKRQQKEEARQKREQEMRERREAKEQLKQEARQRRAEISKPADSTEDNQDGTKKIN